jgi:LTXXQ motif family protein
MPYSSIALATAFLLVAAPVLAQPASKPQCQVITQNSADGGPGWGMEPGSMGYGRGPGSGMGSGMMGRRMAAFAAGQLAFLKTELKITAGQEPKWQAFAESVRDNANSMSGMWRMMRTGVDQGTVPDRLAQRQRFMTARVAAFAKTAVALSDLYAVLTPTQKKIVDGMPLGPMAMPMGMW